MFKFSVKAPTVQRPLATPRTASVKGFLQDDRNSDGDAEVTEEKLIKILGSEFCTSGGKKEEHFVIPCTKRLAPRNARLRLACGDDGSRGEEPSEDIQDSSPQGEIIFKEGLNVLDGQRNRRQTSAANVYGAIPLNTDSDKEDEGGGQRYQDDSSKIKASDAVSIPPNSDTCRNVKDKINTDSNVYVSRRSNSSNNASSDEEKESEDREELMKVLGLKKRDPGVPGSSLLASKFRGSLEDELSELPDFNPQDHETVRIDVFGEAMLRGMGYVPPPKQGPPTSSSQQSATSESQVGKKGLGKSDRGGPSNSSGVYMPTTLVRTAGIGAVDALKMHSRELFGKPKNNR